RRSPRPGASGPTNSRRSSRLPSASSSRSSPPRTTPRPACGTTGSSTPPTPAPSSAWRSPRPPTPPSSRSTTASSGCERTNVTATPHRPGGQPRGDRLPRDPLTACRRDPLDRRLFGCRRRRTARAEGRCRGPTGPGPGNAVLSRHRQGDRRLSRDRRAGRPPRLRFPLREPAVRPRSRGGRTDLRGPPASAIESMGDKITAKAAVSARDVPTVPGISRPGLTDDELIAGADEVGYPVLVKPSAGGGGKGMRRVEAPADLRAALESSRRESAGAFGDDTLFLERFVDTPRHIEV